MRRFNEYLFENICFADISSCMAGRNIGKAYILKYIRAKPIHLLLFFAVFRCFYLQRGDDRGNPWYRYQLIWYQVPSKLKVLVPPIFGAIANVRTSQRTLSTSIFRETNGEDQTTPEHITVASMSLSALLNKS